MGGPIGLLVDGDMVTVRPGSRELSVALSEEVGSRRASSKLGAGTAILDDFGMIDN